MLKGYNFGIPSFLSPLVEEKLGWYFVLKPAFHLCKLKRQTLWAELNVYQFVEITFSLGNFEKYHIAAKFYPPFLLAKTCSFGNKMSLSQ